MIDDRQARRILRRNLRRHGPAVQSLKVIEEAGELIQAVAKMMGTLPITEDIVEHIGEEMADLEITLEQLRMAMPQLEEFEEKWMQRKLMRLAAAGQGRGAALPSDAEAGGTVRMDAPSVRQGRDEDPGHPRRERQQPGGLPPGGAGGVGV